MSLSWDSLPICYDLGQPTPYSRNRLDNRQVIDPVTGVYWRPVRHYTPGTMQSAAVDYSRRNLLRGRIGALAEEPTRPPWALPAKFSALCARCNACIEGCSERILVRGDGGFPVVDFKRGGCSFCGTCVDLCKSGALIRTQEPAFPAKARVDRSCLAGRGITCRACGDACDVRAIRFRLQTGGRAEVNILMDACTGCGACLSICPVGALKIGVPGGGEPVKAT